jgi:hypothetical protein
MKVERLKLRARSQGIKPTRLGVLYEYYEDDEHPKH